MLYQLPRRVIYMGLDGMLTKPVKMNDSLLPKTQFCYTNFALDTEKRKLVTFYPDTSRSFDDLVSVIVMSTGDGFPFMMVLTGFLFHHRPI